MDYYSGRLLRPSTVLSREVVSVVSSHLEAESSVIVSLTAGVFLKREQ